MTRPPIYRKMDKYLLDRKVITQEGYDTIADFVHDLIEKGTHKIEPLPYEHELLHNPKVIRYVFSKKKGRIPWYLLTDGLRIAYGHCVIDEHIEKDPAMPTKELLRRAYYTFRYRDYEKSEYWYVKQYTKGRRGRPKWVHP